MVVYLKTDKINGCSGGCCPEWEKYFLNYFYMGLFLHGVNPRDGFDLKRAGNREHIDLKTAKNWEHNP